MKQIIITAMILLIVSCSETEMINNCGCIESQQRYLDKKVWTGGAWMYYKEWQSTGENNNVDGCFTDKQTEYMVRNVSDYERWLVTCNNN
jgi:hypothetical protein